jgi:hypothetical protein
MIDYQLFAKHSPKSGWLGEMDPRFHGLHADDPWPESVSVDREDLGDLGLLVPWYMVGYCLEANRWGENASFFFFFFFSGLSRDSIAYSFLQLDTTRTGYAASSGTRRLLANWSFLNRPRRSSRTSAWTGWRQTDDIPMNTANRRLFPSTCTARRGPGRPRLSRLLLSLSRCL